MTEEGTPGIRKVSVIIPCRNEERFIGLCLESIIKNDFPKDNIEVLVVEGRSDDGTLMLIENYAKKYAFIKILDNPKRSIPSALNIGIKNSKHEIIVRIDAHAVCKSDYISKCVHYLNQYGAESVGGIWKILPRENSLIGRSIALALSSPFGVGNAHYRFASKTPRWVDTVPFFCCRRRIFDDLGYFNEEIPYSEDMEFNSRIRRAGGRILLVPEILSYYYARSDLKSFWFHNVRNGMWAVLPLKYARGITISPRHLVPMTFVGSLFGSGTLAFWRLDLILVSLFIFSLYSLMNFGVSARLAIREGEPKLLIGLPISFLVLHFAYGLGSWLGVGSWTTSLFRPNKGGHLKCW